MFRHALIKIPSEEATLHRYLVAPLDEILFIETLHMLQTTCQQLVPAVNTLCQQVTSLDQTKTIYLNTLDIDQPLYIGNIWWGVQ